jgi:ESCRT-I complex subunit VPS28
MADVFSIITTLQALEKAYIKDVVEPAEYTKHCEKLLAKFAAAFRQIESEFPRVEDFVRKYKVNYSLINQLSEDFF